MCLAMVNQIHVAKTRAVYDQYGANGLKHGVAPREGYEGYDGGYEFHGNSEEIFNEFFGGKNPFSGTGNSSRLF